MALVNPNIAMSYRGVEMPQQNMLADYAAIQQIQGGQQAQQLNALKIQEYERTRSEEEGARNFLRGKDIASPDTRAGLTQFGKTGLALAKSLSEQDAATLNMKNTQSQISERDFGLQDKKLKFAWNSVGDAATPELAIQKITDGIKDGVLKPQDGAVEIQRLQKITTPDEFKQYRVETILRLLDAKDKLVTMLPKIARQDTGGAITPIQDNPALPGYGLPVAGMAPLVKTATIGERTAQGQLKVAQDRLAAEAATGVLSPDSQELAANLYLQTGTLPPMGIGKGGANLKASIMNRAAEISKTGGATPAAGAANIVSAKQDIGAQTKALKDFSTGVQGQMVTSFNTAIDHLGTMDKLADALNNGDVKAINSIGNAVARQTGAPAPTNFDAARGIVGAEIQKAIIRAGGTGKERQEAADAFAAAGSPAQLKGVINTYKQLLGGQLNSLEMQYSANTGRKDFGTKLSPAAKETLSNLRGENSAAPAGGAAPAPNIDALLNKYK